ncbi:MAG: exopolysaccharide biosynthesis polyprenyl glycosylphosphotransferase [Candidatus Aenigmatarchaeota archaeon]
MKFVIIAFILLSLYLNLFLSYIISIQFVEDKFNHPLSKYLWLPLIYFISFFIIEINSNRIDKNYSLIELFKGNFVSFLLTMLVLFFTKDFNKYSRLIQIAFFLSNFLMPLYMELFFKILKKTNIFKVKILLISDENSFERLTDWAKRNLIVKFEILQQVNLKDIGKIQLERKKILSVDYILIDIPENKLMKTIQILDYLQGISKRIIYIPSNIPYFLGSAKILYTLSSKNFAIFIENKLLEKNNLVFKRMFDIVFSILFLLLFSFPMVLIYISILLIYRQNPIFKHERVGQNGKIFYVLKFRTMKKNADELLKILLDTNPVLRKEWEENHKLKDDPRITKIGKFLRKTSLDELPQLINVIKGEMSLVGPRPIVKDEIKKYGKYFELYKAVKPGITGLWQISGRNNISYNERVKLDTWYVKNWTIEMDIMILIRTSLIFFKTRDAY